VKLIDLVKENDRMREALEWIARRRSTIGIDPPEDNFCGLDFNDKYVAEYILDEIYEGRKDY